MLRDIEYGVKQSLEGDFSAFPVPVMAIYDGGEIVWCNELCSQTVFDGRDMLGEHLLTLLPDVDMNLVSPGQGFDLSYGNKMYTVFYERGIREGKNIWTVCFFENTALKLQAHTYQRTKPSMALIMVDNYEELTQDYKDTERAQIMGRVESAVEQYMLNHSSYYVKVSRDRYIAIIQEQGFEGMLADRFAILDQVREIQVGDRMRATLSIGIGRDAVNLFEGEAMARQAVDMCLGRGGDQVAIKSQNGYEFYGGVSKAVEKRTKVKTRIIAAALGELIESSGNVLIMGHRFADLDCFGSAIGLMSLGRSMGKPTHIVLDRQKNLVHPLLEKLLSGGYSDQDFVSPDNAINYINASTLLIVTDTHVPYILESEEVFRAARQVVVIDHHRKMVGHIDNAVIFYHEPYASSACEMVAELAQYFDVPPQFTRLEADAMMSGIMLDTKNFIMHTGVRTFEAAAYLRRLGADTTEVRKLFASSMDAYQQKSALVSNAELYCHCAIAIADAQHPDINLIAPQAADELMTISGVEASFIIFLSGNQVNISARSFGAFNVQVIMEGLGGGGHQTMAAAQFPDHSMENVRRMLLEAIDTYCAN